MKLSLAFVTAGLAAFNAVSGASIEKRWGKSSSSKNIDVTILNYALTLEYLEAKFYSDALKKYDEAAFKAAGYEPFVRQRIVEIANTEAIHVKTLKGALGKQATSACTYTFPYNSVSSFLALSAAIEGVGVSAYLGAAPLITSKDYLAVAASIVTVEARHQSVVSEFIGQDGVAEVFDTALDFSQVYSLVTPFIKSCPKSNPSLPVQQFPALTIKESNPMAGDKIHLKFTPSKSRKCHMYYAHILNGLSDTVVPVGKDGLICLPKDLSGRVYIIVTNSKTLTDAHTVAGPAFFEASEPDMTSHHH